MPLKRVYWFDGSWVFWAAGRCKVLLIDGSLIIGGTIVFLISPWIFIARIGVKQEKITSGFMRFAHAHVLWMFVEWPTDTRLYAKDTISDPISRRCSRWYWPICATSLLVPALIGYGLGGPDEAVRAFFWAGCLRVSLMQQLTWTVNSLGHMVGGKTEGSRDESRNMPWGVTLCFLVKGSIAIITPISVPL